MHMDDEMYKAAHKIATENQHKVTLLIPEKILKKEEKLLLKFTNAKGSTVNKLKALYRFMDDLYTYVHKVTPCHKGCSNCCHYNVSISEFEADFISNETGLPKITQEQGLPINYHGLPCPFLKEDECTIYSSRPFACRRHHFLGKTEEWCSSYIANDYEFPKIEFSEVQASYEFILNESKQSKRRDIRAFFSTS